VKQLLTNLFFSWADKGSPFFLRDTLPQHPSIDDHRHSIRHLVLISNVKPPPQGQVHAGDGEVSDLDWMFKIDWSMLPELETLHLDLKWVLVDGRSFLSVNRLTRGALRMKQQLSLKKLVLMNCDIDLGTLAGRTKKQELEILFAGSMVEGLPEIDVEPNKGW